MIRHFYKGIFNGVLNYINNALKSDSSTLVDVVAALHDYYVKAKAYFDSIK